MNQIEHNPQPVVTPKWFWSKRFLTSLVLLTFLILFAVIAFPFVQNYRVIKHIESLGGRIDETEPGSLLRTLPADWQKFLQVNYKNQLLPFESVTRLSLGASSASDIDLTYLKKYKGLKQIFLSGTQVSDAGLIHLQGIGGNCRAWEARHQLASRT